MVILCGVRELGSESEGAKRESVRGLSNRKLGHSFTNDLVSVEGARTRRKFRVYTVPGLSRGLEYNIYVGSDLK